MEYAHNFSTGELKAGRSRVHGHSQPHIALEANLGYRRPFLKNKTTEKYILTVQENGTGTPSP